MYSSRSQAGVSVAAAVAIVRAEPRRPHWMGWSKPVRQSRKNPARRLGAARYAEDAPSYSAALMIAVAVWTHPRTTLDLSCVGARRHRSLDRPRLGLAHREQETKGGCSIGRCGELDAFASTLEPKQLHLRDTPSADRSKAHSWCERRSFCRECSRGLDHEGRCGYQCD
jgi:hypothetical protein